MANINLLSWNIEVFGPGKYGNSANSIGLVNLIAQVAVQQNSNMVVLMELMSSVAQQICYSVCEAIANATGNPWMYVQLQARPGGDRESYGMLWQTNANFAVLNNGAGQMNVGLSPLDFPCNFSDREGRRAALATFRTTDTNNNFTVSVYHAPPNARAIRGLEVLAKTPGLYTVDNAGAAQAVGMRLLGADYNLDVNIQPEYSWLTDPVPAAPPPAAAGQGAGTAPITAADTTLMNMSNAVARWGNDLAAWSNVATDYRALQLDNIFWAAAPGAVGGPVDLVAMIMNPASPVRVIAQSFVTLDAVTQGPAFPFAFSLPPPLNVNLSLGCCAWMLARYGVSDHLPVFTSAAI